MAGLGALLMLASLAQNDWYCSSALMPGVDQPHSAVRVDFTLSDDGAFEAKGTIVPTGDTHQFGWSGSWTLIDGQLAMIGQTRGRTFGLARSGEMRAMANLTQADVILLNLSHDTSSGRALRCLTYKLE